jgi:hypothetical protein
MTGTHFIIEKPFIKNIIFLLVWSRIISRNLQTLSKFKIVQMTHLCNLEINQYLKLCLNCLEQVLLQTSHWLFYNAIQMQED